MLSAVPLAQPNWGPNRREPSWWDTLELVAELARIWGVRNKAHGVMADYEPVEVARVAGDCEAFVLVARTGSGLFASGYAARWGDGSTAMEPSVGSVPFDTELEARRAGLKELQAALQAGRGAARHQQRMLLLEKVQEADRRRGLFG